MGPTPGGKGGSILNMDCDNVDFPTEPHCTRGWEYASKTRWEDDNTIRLYCKGNIHSGGLNNIIFFVVVINILF